jgi:guanylate kinase
MRDWTLKTTRKGLLVVLSAPSGGGKSTLTKSLLAADPQLAYSVSHTTRPIRPGEVDGRHYHFIDDEAFERLVAQSAFYEHAVVHGHRYGTSRKRVEEMLDGGKDVLMDLDVQGGLNVKRQTPDSVLIFLLPPSLEVLRLRLERRGTDAQEVIAQRLEKAEVEIRHWQDYDFAVINEDLDVAVAKVRGIVEAERHRPSRLELHWSNGPRSAH